MNEAASMAAFSLYPQPINESRNPTNNFQGAQTLYNMVPRLMRKTSRPLQKLNNSVNKRIRWAFYYFKAKFVLPIKRARRKKRRLKIEVITMMYNEALMASLFVRHYAPWADTLTVFYSESTDGTRRELEAAAVECGLKRLSIMPFEFPDGFDDVRKIECINQAVLNSTADFAICVDADEFVYPWPFDGGDPRGVLENETANIVRCRMFQVYRHFTDANIDPKKPPLFQRRHGSPDSFQEAYDKPCIVRPDSGVQFHPGCHSVTTPYPESQIIWRGAHWGKADDFCLQRYLRDRSARLSKANRQKGYGGHLFSQTEKRLGAELQSHERDPQLF